ncbi:MAG TPA: hypothetical protein PKD26_01380 [Pyrinomonadaceae bacterium]|nr:hypothetical protein [Pyrinomonadaceae bacterium]
MDENLHEKPEETKTVPSATPQHPGWREYLESEDATRYVYLVFAFIAIAMVMSFLQFRTDAICCGDWDGYYHIRWSQLLWENFSQGKWLPTFEWLPLTVLDPVHYNDHHFLFHLLQIPFLWFFEPVMAAKIAAVAFATLAIFSVYWLIHYYRIRYPLLWLAAIFTCANMFYYRMNMAKAPPLTIIITVAGIYLLFERKYKWLLPLMFAFVWTYSLFPLLFIAAVIWAAIIGWNERRLEWQPVAYTFGGMLLGNVINPYFPNNITLFIEHFKTKLAVAGKFAVSVGGEWYPYSGMELMTHFPVALAAMLIGYVLFVPRNGKLPEKAAFFLVFATMLLAGQFSSKRYAEYFPPFAVLFAAFSWQAFLSAGRVQLPDEFRREIEPFLDSDKKTNRQEWLEAARTAAVWVIGIILIGYFYVNIIGLSWLGVDQPGLMNTIKENDVNDRYRRSMEWAQSLDKDGRPNIPPGARIFNSNWDDFPKLFFHNTQNSYVYGLDPNYLYSRNPDLYKLLLDITDGRANEIGPIIRERFGAEFIFADAKENEQMVAKALESGWVDLVYEDDEARILRIRSQKGEPFSSAADDEPETPEEKRLLDEMEANEPRNSNADVDEEN